MNYADFRSKIKSGDLLAWSHRAGWFDSWYDFKINLVRLFTMSEYTHVGVAYVFHGRVWVIESVTPVVRMVPLSNLLPCYHLDVVGGWNAQAERYAFDMIGKGAYSQFEAAISLFGWNTRYDDKLECAEFVQQVYDQAGLDTPVRATPANMVLWAQLGYGVTSYLE